MIDEQILTLEAACADLPVDLIDHLFDFSNKQQRDFYYAIWQLQVAKQNLNIALEALKQNYGDSK